MNLTELEVAAGRLLEEQKRLKTIDSELDVLSQEITQDPKRNEKDQAFYALIGLDWSDPGHQDRAAALKRERGDVLASIREVHGQMFTGLSSDRLIVPLDPIPVSGGRSFTFRFRSGATFPKSVEAFSAMLGIPSPLSLGDVTISEDRVVVAESDEYFAKKKLVDAFEDLRKALKRKLS
ncbi:MAG: hypothetical protein JRM79_01450 [Nitrososphaerota archaeon]|jgi:hypothetical protein|nr:hypothetical protein [Nitrososphaerota archaeon]MCL5672268.1 hypothetical protein [Nitrososphaerota archaeon]MDG6903590.1 hypothetical protein [Nitrososphaerota archaeon]MDG6912247.1 hypothetical protein [Nitrososphaerota archaeon]MDG6924667.1 hypothetical protein [Nitrososphaerota archaeon]